MNILIIIFINNYCQEWQSCSSKQSTEQKLSKYSNGITETPSFIIPTNWHPLDINVWH
jgi:hypothetical protein